jgi:PIN domain nuclease of toxin-antitoxin system
MNHDKNSHTYILDTSALMTYIENEDGSEDKMLRLPYKTITS